MEKSNMFVQFNSEIENRYSVIIDEDHNTVYGYLMREEEIVSDVWLYNVGDSPEFVDWENPELMPFPSPIGLSVPNSETIRIIDTSLIDVKWGYSKSKKVKAFIYYNGSLFARLSEDDFPGESINALCDSRLANKLRNSVEQV
jgi:hypothetical protein